MKRGQEKAAAYGLALAAATWLYLVIIHPAFILGMILLGTVWWCSHKLTWDCTLIDEDEDASGSGLLQTVGEWKKPAPGKKKPPAPRSGQKQKSADPHPPGLWVVYFSLAALPLFGIGQMLLPGADLEARHRGFTYLFVYVTAALGLLLTTSFLGLRRYLRQRYLPMPGMIAFGWIRFGAGVAAFVLIAALLLPRPGADAAWQTLRYEVDYRLHQASEYAIRLSPHGSGQGRSGNEPGKSEAPKNTTAASRPLSGQEQSPGSSPAPGQNGPAKNQGAPSQPTAAEGAGGLYHLFKILFLFALAVLAGWWLFRRRDLILQAIKSFIAAVAQFFRDLFRLGSPSRGPAARPEKPNPARRRFAAYHNPFLTGKETAWTRGQLILYSYEALQAWAEEHGIAARPEQTAREFCNELAGRFPEINSELNGLSFLYGQAAYTTAQASGCDLEPVKKLWRHFYS